MLKNLAAEPNSDGVRPIIVDFCLRFELSMPSLTPYQPTLVEIVPRNTISWITMLIAPPAWSAGFPKMVQINNYRPDPVGSPLRRMMHALYFLLLLSTVNRMKIYIFIALCLSFASLCFGGGTAIVSAGSHKNAWSLSWNTRTLTVEWSVSPQLGGRNFNISIAPVNKADFAADEIAEALGFAVQQMHADGNEPFAIRRIYIPSVMVDEWQHRLREAARKSAEWQNWIRRGRAQNAPSQQIVASLMNEYHVFSEMETVLQNEGYILKVDSVEEILCGRDGDSPLPELAMIWFKVAPSQKQPTKE